MKYDWHVYEKRDGWNLDDERKWYNGRPDPQAFQALIIRYVLI